MSDSYYEVSTLYALGRVLAYERILLWDGVYPQLKRLKKFEPGLGSFLKSTLRDLDNRLDEGKFHRYDRLALAEAAMERDPGFLRTRTYLEFKHRYEAPNSVMRTALMPAKNFIENLSETESVFDELLKILKNVTKELSDTTEVPTTIDGQ
jgi:hypothetical protein